jgi:hypothetical protein
MNTLALPAPSPKRTRQRKFAAEDEAVNNSTWTLRIHNASPRSNIFIVAATGIDWSTGDETPVMLSSLCIAMNKAHAERRFRREVAQQVPATQIKMLSVCAAGEKEDAS